MNEIALAGIIVIGSIFAVGIIVRGLITHYCKLKQKLVWGEKIQ